MPGAIWFEGAHVNYAQQVFRHGRAAHAAGHPAIVFQNEALAGARRARGDELARTASSGRPPSRRRARPRRAAGRPGLRLPAQHAADGGGVPGGGEPRGRLVDLLARHGAGGGARPFPADRAEGADRLRRLPLRRQAHRPAPAAGASCSTSCRACATWCCGAISTPTPMGSAGRAAASRPRLRCADRGQRCASSRTGCPSTIRCGWSIPAARPACRRRSCMATAA